MSSFTNIYDRKPQPYHTGQYWKHLLMYKGNPNIQFTAAEITHISEFIQNKSISSRISPGRMTQYIQMFRLAKRFYPGDLSQITYPELLDLIEKCHASERYSNSTKALFVVSLKAYLKFEIKRGYSSLPKDDIDEIKPMEIAASIKRPEDLPSRADIHAITSSPHCSVMFAALINTIYYTGGRVSEILSLNWEDLIFENQYVKVMIRDTKTNKIRYVPCVQALPFIAAWRRQYPTAIVGGPNGPNPVFVTYTEKNGYRRMLYGNSRVVWQRLQDRANVHPKNGKKYFVWHSLRGAHITNLAAANVPDAVIRDIAWGNQNTQMMSHYLLLNDKTKETLILQSAGLEVEENPVENAVVLCPHCNAPNGPRDQYCRFCGQALTSSSETVQRMLSENAADTTVDIIGILAQQLGIDKEQLKTKIMNAL